MGLGSDDNNQQKFVQRSLLTAANPDKQSDGPLDLETIQAQKRAAMKMRDGVDSAYGVVGADGRISFRGTDVAPGSPSATPPPPAAAPSADSPKEPDIIPPPIDSDAPYQNPTNESQRQANDRYEANKRYRDRTGKGQPDKDIIP